MRNLNCPLHILLIGPLPPPLGGVTVLFNHLVRELSLRSDVSVEIINTSRSRRGLLNSIFHGIWVLFKMLSAVPRSNVTSFHSTTNGVLHFGPLVWIICKIYRKPWILRCSGSMFDQVYNSLSKPVRWFVRKTLLDADSCLFETKSLVPFISKITNKPVYWYANSRPLVISDNAIGTKKGETAIARRFVFISHVRPSKGVREIVAASNKINEDIVIDVFGPLMDGISEAEFTSSRLNYQGVLQLDEVIPMLKKYDALLLPTYWVGEGYPGIILEAYSVGLPVISTNWKSIPEIVDETSGILIEPQNVDALCEAILTLLNLDQEKYARLRSGAFEKAKQFDSTIWAEKFVEHCTKVFWKYR